LEDFAQHPADRRPSGGGEDRPALSDTLLFRLLIFGVQMAGAHGGPVGLPIRRIACWADRLLAPGFALSKRGLLLWDHGLALLLRVFPLLHRVFFFWARGFPLLQEGFLLLC